MIAAPAPARRLARAGLTHEGVRFPGFDRKRGVAQRDRPTVGFRDMRKGNEAHGEEAEAGLFWSIGLFSESGNDSR